MTTLTMTPSGVSELMLQEGTILQWYKDATGTWTCLTGHTNAAGAPLYPPARTFTRSEAADVLSSDLSRIYMPAVAKFVTRPMLPQQSDAFGSFTFNAGAGNFASSSMLRCFNAGDIQGAADGFLSWTKSKGVVLPGLVKRRQVERGMFLNGTYPGVVLATADTAQAIKDQHMIAKGANGEDVVTLQKQLTTLGFAVKPDGDFGNATDNAVREFQSTRGLPVDGIVGLKTWMALDKAQDLAIHVDTDKPVLASIEKALNAAAVSKGAVGAVVLPKVVQPVDAKGRTVAQVGAEIAAAQRLVDAAPAVATPGPLHIDNRAAASVPVAAWWQFWKRTNA